MKKTLIISCLSLSLLFGAGLVLAQEDTELDEMISLDENVSAEELGVEEATILPDNPLYLFKELGRDIQSLFTFDSIKKAELKEKFTNEKLIEVRQMVEKEKSQERIESAIRNYQKETEEAERSTEKIRQRAEENAEVGKFLDKFIQNQTLQQRVLQKLEEQVPDQAMEKIKEARETSLENFGQVMIRLEEKENIQERLQKNLLEVEGSEFKELKQMELLQGLGEKLPEEIKEIIQKVQANSLTNLKEKIEALPAEKIEQFQAYTETINGVKEKQVEILDNLKVELKALPLIQDKIIQTRNNVMEKIRIRAEEINCPEIEKPSTDYCQDGRIVVRKDDAGCVIDFGCVRLNETNETSGACIALWDPVCGENGRTYSNKCYAEQAGALIAYLGQCKRTECQIDSDCPQTRCIGAQTKCVNGECVVPRCTESFSTEPNQEQIREENKEKAGEENGAQNQNLLQKNIIEPIKKLAPVQQLKQESTQQSNQE